AKAVEFVKRTLCGLACGRLIEHRIPVRTRFELRLDQHDEIGARRGQRERRRKRLRRADKAYIADDQRGRLVDLGPCESARIPLFETDDAAVAAQQSMQLAKTDIDCVDPHSIAADENV